MNKILLVIKREYLTRVRKKSFIVMTIAAPLLISVFYGIIIYFAVNRDIGETEKRIFVADSSGKFVDKLTPKETISFTYGVSPQGGNIKAFLEKEGYYALLSVSDSGLKKISLIAIDQPSLNTVDYIEDQLADVLKQRKLESMGVTEAQIKDVNEVNINIQTAKATDKGAESSSAEVNSIIGLITAVFIYMFIFLYGVQVMKGVIEEKTNRIVEVIISSLKPFELMMGKIIGIALVGLTQFVIWIVLVSMLSGIIFSQMNISPDSISTLAQNGKAMGQADTFMSAILNFDFIQLASVFVFYFITGYLFYGALFAAIGSAVDNETDTQQFMLPVTMPLVLALVLAQSAVVSNPNGALAFWLSVIPFTSPVVMMVRLPFGVPSWQIFLSMGCMIAGFIFTAWLAGRIYRIGILMYGKKPSYKELAKWLFAKG